MTDPPTVHSLPDTASPPVIVGAQHDICLEGNTGGTNGTNFWTVGGTTVNAVDISEIVNADNTRPLCDICSCYDRYISIEAIGRRIREELDRTGFAAFIVTMYQLDGVDSVNRRSRECYGLPNRYLFVLRIQSVEGVQVDISSTITSAQNKSTTKHFSLTTGESTLVSS